MSTNIETSKVESGDPLSVDDRGGNFLTANDGLLINPNTRALLDTLTQTPSTEVGIRAITYSLRAYGLVMPGKIFMLGSGGHIMGRHLISSLTTSNPDSLPQEIDRIGFFMPESGGVLGMSAVYQDPYRSPAASRQEAEIPIAGKIAPDNPMRLCVATREYNLTERKWSTPSVEDAHISDEMQVLKYIRGLAQAYLGVIEQQAQ